jgi:carbon monoxide dehydrogenase subunit G
MRLAGTHTIHASPEALWPVVTSPEALQGCVPGLQSLEIVEPGRHFRGSIVMPFGGSRMVFPIVVEWLELVEPRLARMRAEAAFAGTAISVVSDLALLTMTAGVTRLEWKAEVGLAGPAETNRFLAQLVGVMAHQAATAFLHCIATRLDAT